MGKKRASPRQSAGADSTEQLSDAVTRLSQEVQSLWDVLNAIREDLSWAMRNGIPPHADAPLSHGVLKRMALNPSADDWGERLQIDYGPTDTPRESNEQLRAVLSEMLDCPELKQSEIDQATRATIERACKALGHSADSPKSTTSRKEQPNTSSPPPVSPQAAKIPKRLKGDQLF